jgi:predicted permease
MVDPDKLYRLLTRFYPARFREEYRGPMVRQFRDECRDAQDWRARTRLWLRTIGDLATSLPAEIVRELSQDLRYSLRLYRSRSFSAALAVAALGLAIGASTGVFSVLNALLLRGLPFSDPARLVELRRPPVDPLKGRGAFTEWARLSPYMETVAAFSTTEMNITHEHDALRVNVAETSANFFALLGTKPVSGRMFATDEDLPGRTSVAVISHSLWQQLYGGHLSAAGATLRLNGVLFTIIGVAPPRFDYPAKTAIWIPTAFDFEAAPKRGAFFFRTIGRLEREISLAEARRMFERDASRLNPEILTVDLTNPSKLSSLRDHVTGDVRQASWVLAGIVLLLLLAACANVAQLLLSRATERRQEFEVRSAMGASRARLLQQLTTEALALTIAGSAFGLFVAHWTSQLVSLVSPAPLASQEYSIRDWNVLVFAAGLAIAIGVVLGVVTVSLVSRLRSSLHTIRVQPGTRDVGTRRMRSGLVAMQAAITLTLLAGSLVMCSTLFRMLDADLGFRSASVVTLKVSLQGSRYRTGSAEWQYYTDALDRLRRVPGVEAAGAVSFLPLSDNAYMMRGFKLDSGQTLDGIIINAATPGYFLAMGTTFLAGRDFLTGRSAVSERAVIVNQELADRAGLGASIVGRRLITSWSREPYPIVGLVATARLAGPEHPGGPQIYWAVQEEPPPSLTLVARVRGRAEAFLAPCRDAIRSVDREVPVHDIQTLNERVAYVLARPKFYTTATIFLAVLAVLLAAVGIYGASSHSIAHRTREIGVRMALGASRGRVRAMVMRENLMPIALGAAAGIAGALAFGRYFKHLISSAEPVDIWVCTAAAALLCLISAIAGWSATARILAIDPAEAVRAE